MSPQSSGERWIFRLGGAAAVIGSLVAMVGNLLHPATPSGDPEGVARTIAESDAWVAVHLAIMLGLILMLGGLAALGRSIHGPLAGGLAWFASVAAVAGATVGLVLVTLDGIAARHIALAWAAAPPDEAATALRLVLAEETINFALAALFNVLFAGVTFILFGLAVALGHVYPRGLGWVVVVAGVGSVGVGVLQAQVGEPTGLTRILTIIFPTMITLWVALMGILLIRRASAPERPDPRLRTGDLP